MGSSNLEVFLSKGVVFSTKNRFSSLLTSSQDVSDLKPNIKEKTSKTTKLKKTSSIEIISSLKSNKSSL
jgi:hypothetical protein